MLFPILRSIRKPLMLVLPVAIALGSASHLGAEPKNPLSEPPSKPDEAKNPLAELAPGGRTTPQPAAGGRLTIEQLGEALDSYGKNTQNNNGQTYYQITIKRDTWTIPITVSLSPNGNIIWIQSPLTVIPNPNKASAAALMNLLKKNAEIGPVFFQLINTRLQLTEPLVNTGMNADTLGAWLESFVKILQQTEPLWKQDVLTPE